MSANYTLYLTTDAGVRIASPINSFVEATFTRQLHKIGTCELVLPGNFDPSFVERVDRMLQVWRTPPGSRRSLWRAFFIRGWREYRDGRQDRLRVWGVDALDLLRRRIVAAYAGTSNSDYTDFADDIMKAVVRDALLDSTPPTDAGSRAMSGLTVAADLSAGPVVDIPLAWEELLTSGGTGALPELAQLAREAGTEVFFDVVESNVTATSIAFQFRTRTGQPGTDRTDPTRATYALFSESAETLRDPFYEEDWSDEVNYVYAGGQNEGVARIVEQRSDATRYGLSRWNRCEGFADARRHKSEDAVADAAYSALSAGRPQIRAGGVAKDTPALRYGVDWDFGDLVAVKARGREFNALIPALTLNLRAGQSEVVTARLEYRT